MTLLGTPGRLLETRVRLRQLNTPSIVVFCHIFYSVLCHLSVRILVVVETHSRIRVKEACWNFSGPFASRTVPQARTSL